MPEMTGEDFIRTIKAHEDFKNIPVILYSSVDDDQLRLNLKAYEIEGFLTKPARYSEILRMVSKAMSKSPPVEKSESQTLDSNSASAEKTNSEPPASSSLDILIAEDNEVNQMFIKYIMEDMGVAFKIVENGRLAVDKWKLLSPKLVLMDISMPDWNGYEATQKIRALEAQQGRPRTPIIAVTAHALTGDRQKCLDNDMDDYLSKPVSIEKLKALIAKWTDINASLEQSAA